MTLASFPAVLVPSLLAPITDPRPRRLTPAGLREITRDYAAHPELWKPQLRFADEEHWSIRVHADDSVDIWLISWLQTQSTSLHDHGDSAGSFTVVSGRLREYQATGDPFEVTPGSSRSFGKGYVHDVYNPYAEAAVSVHAYSPPLSSMSYYEQTDSGLELLRTDATVIPEGSPAP